MPLAAEETALREEQLLERRNPRLARQGAIRLEERHLLREIGVLELVARHRRLDARKGVAMAALAEELDRRNADVAFLIVTRLLQQPHCAGASDRRKRFHDSQLQLPFTALEQRTHAVRCTRQLEPAGEPHHPPP